MAEAQTNTRGIRKQRKGVVVSRSGNKSLTVLVERRKKHPLYGKVIRQSRKFHVHDEENKAKVGDVVCIVECRPMSKTKRWRLTDVVTSR